MDEIGQNYIGKNKREKIRGIDMGVFFYLTGIVMLVYCMKNELITLFFMWPFVIYGTGAVIALDTDFGVFNKWFSEDGVYVSMYIMLMAILLPLVIEKILFYGSRLFSDGIKNIAVNSKAIIFNIANSSIYRWYLIIQETLLIIFIIIALLTGDIVLGNYQPGEPRLWLEIQFLTENILILIEIYLFCLIVNDKYLKRNNCFEILMAITVILRVMCGTRLFLFGLCFFVIVLYVLRYKKYKKAFLIGVIGSCVFIGLGFFRNDALAYSDFIDVLLPIMTEAYFDDVTLFISSNIITEGIDVSNSSFALSFFYMLVPRFLDRDLLQNEFSMESVATSLGVDSLSPLGGFSFLAHFIYAFGIYWFVPLLFIAFFIILMRKMISSSLGIFMAFSMMQPSLHFWRDGMPIGIKSMIIHTFLNMFFLLMLFRLGNKKQISDDCI